MSKKEILDYVRQTPYNTNVSVVNSLVDSYREEVLSKEGGVGQKGVSENSEVFNGIAPEKASGSYSHAEGYNTTASGDGSHAEGSGTKVTGRYSHAEGQRTIASGLMSHAEGFWTVASGIVSHVEGRYNIPDTSDNTESGTPNNKYTHIVGNGTAKWNPDTQNLVEIRSNAHTLDWDGNAWYAGDVLSGGKDMDDPNAISLKKLSETVANLTARLEALEGKTQPPA